jgi:hypothetical protein
MNNNPANQLELDRIITNLVTHKSRWQSLDLTARCRYLQECLVETLAVADEWTIACCDAKGIARSSQLYGEEHIIGPTALVRYLRLLITSLAQGGKLAPPRWRRQDDRDIAQILPADLFDRLLWFGYRGEVWIEPGQEPTQTQIDNRPVKLALVLGAGNVSAIAPIDALHQLCVENRTVIIKLNPVNDYLLPYLDRALSPLIQAGFLHLVTGDASVGKYLCHHPQIETIHITGSQATHDAIVWGDSESERIERKQNHQPRLTKTISSELGCVTPIVIVPGKWSHSDLHFQARHVAASIAHNASFNCAAGQILVLAKGWHQRLEFLQLLRAELQQIPPRRAYYPGSIDRYQTFLDRYPQAELYGERTESTIPWTIIPDLDPNRPEYAFNTEAFCGLLGIVNLSADRAAQFLNTAVEFVNHSLWGTLSCTVIIDRSTQRQYRSEFDRAIATLQYGAIGINVWSGMLFYLGITSWGAYPGNPLDRIGSGIGIAHNTYLFDYPQKSIVFAPFRPITLPAYFATHRHLKSLALALIQFEAKPTWGNLIPTALAALRG